MPASRFREVLPILEDKHDKQVGVCLMGPVGKGEEIIWMEGWAWQQNGNKIAAASGTAGKPVGATRSLRDPEDFPPFKRPDEWMVQTKREPRTADFDLDKPVLVQAMALVKNGRDRDLVQWSQAVKLEEHY
jgi:hypothetical protein